MIAGFALKNKIVLVLMTAITWTFYLPHMLVWTISVPINRKSMSLSQLKNGKSSLNIRISTEISFIWQTLYFHFYSNTPYVYFIIVGSTMRIWNHKAMKKWT